MADEPEAVTTVSASQAMTLLLLEPADLKRLERPGAFKPIAPGRYGLVELVQAFVRHVRSEDGAALVSSAALAKHFDCVPAYIRKLVEQGVIEKRPDGRYDPDQCRAAYLKHLREARKLSPRGAADVALQQAKAELVQLRVGERKGALIPGVQHEARVDAIAGVILSALSSMPAQVAAFGDLAMRRRLERWVVETRIAMAKTMDGLGDAEGEPDEAPNGTHREVRTVPANARLGV